MGFLNRQGYENLILVDEFDNDTKQLNLINKKYKATIEMPAFFDWFGKENISPAAMFYLGARTDTIEFNSTIHQELNVDYSQHCGACIATIIYG